MGYYTIPPMNELAELVDEDGSCFVDGFTIGRYDYGNVYFPDRFNVAGLDIDSIGKNLWVLFKLSIWKEILVFILINNHLKMFQYF